MDKFDIARMCKGPVVNKVSFIQSVCRDKSVLDLGCICHDATFSERDPNWLHQKIKDVAGKVVGVDYLEGEGAKLRPKYDIRYGDVTKPLDLTETFEVIVAGDLIEHLTNFEGFLNNCTRLLRDGGVMVISTPNPFYADVFHYVAYKGNFFINPEHTCWLDPQALSQLVTRFGFSITEVHYIEHSWRLANHIGERKGSEYDVLRGQWPNNSAFSRLTRRVISRLFGAVYNPYKYLTMNNTKMVRYADYLAVIKKVGT